VISFHFGNIFIGNMMTGNKQEQLPSAEVTQFVEYLTEILTNTRPSPTPEMHKLMSRFKRLNVGESFHTEIDPLAFGRMGSILYRGVNPTMGELSKTLALPLSTMTRMVDAGESFGIVQRLPDPDDGRIVRVALTDDGRQLHEAMKDMQAQGIKKVLVCLTPEERAILLTLLRKITISIKTV
jgi:DNA-binding MarR family transcriptional regulator